VSRRAWGIGVVAGVLVFLGLGAYAVPRLLPECASDVTSLPADRATSPFLDAEERVQQPDGDRDAVVQALAEAPPPFGEVLGAVGYHYEQWARVSAFEQGIGVRTRDNPDFTMLDDESLEPRWSVEIETKRSAYDATDEQYLVATLPAKRPVELVSLDADTGERRWCTELEGGDPVRADDPFATQFLDDGDVAVLAPAGGDRERLVRIDGRDGSQVWQRTLDADSGDFLGDLGDGTLLLGGRAQSRLFDRDDVARRKEGATLVAVSASDGTTIWTKHADAGSDLHVLGTDPDSGTVFVQEWNGQTRSARLIAIGDEGNQEWYAVPARGGNFDATLRSGRILVRTESRWSAYAIEDGHLLWTRVLPDRPQFLPYGYELDSIPMLDPEHALVAGTTALHVLDLRTGAMTSAALPTDGINTTYWPYQVAISPGLVAVATNTGAVVVRRTPLP
jgi:outer membrane protein assembly factor BamB